MRGATVASAPAALSDCGRTSTLVVAGGAARRVVAKRATMVASRLVVGNGGDCWAAHADAWRLGSVVGRHRRGDHLPLRHRGRSHHARTAQGPSEHRAHVVLELRRETRLDGVVPGVVHARRQLVEPHPAVGQGKQLHAERADGADRFGRAPILRRASLPALLIAAVATRMSAGDRFVAGIEAPGQLAAFEEAGRVPRVIARTFLETVAPCLPGDVADLADPRSWKSAVPTSGDSSRG